MPYAASGSVVRIFPVSNNVTSYGLQMGVVDLMKALPVHLIACLMAQQPQGAGDCLSVCLSVCLPACLSAEHGTHALQEACTYTS